jgi:uncharacterized protein (TIGR02679 family)
LIEKFLWAVFLAQKPATQNFLSTQKGKHMMDATYPENIQRAVTFFRQADLERLLYKLREKYIEIGTIGGQIQFKDSTAYERREIASFLQKPPYRDTTIRIKLSDIDNVLRQSSFQCTLPELLAAFYPGQPLITRPQQRAARTSHQEQFQQALQAITAAQPDASRSQQWLQHGPHGQDWLFARYKNASTDEQEQQLATIRHVAALLNQLPGPASPERLALFAQRTSGDPHNLDPGRPAGRLLLQALSDLARTNIPLPGQGRVQELHLYQNAGLLVDTISSNVAVFHLSSATNLDGSPDPFITAAGPRILLLPLCQLLQWQALAPATPDIYVIENPQVFEEVIASLQANHNTSSTLPTLVCTSGWPSVASLTLLDLLLTASPANLLHYSGDFDLKGLQIAAYLIERYPQRCHPWHIDPPAYTHAMQADGIAAQERDLQMLDALPAIFAPLVEVMQEQRKWAYQEGIVQLLVEDVQG